MIQFLPSFGFNNIRNPQETDKRRIAADYALAKKYYLEGKKLIREEKIDKAQEKFLKSVETSPDFAESYVEMGNIYMKKEMYDEAIEEYNKAIEAYLRLEAYVSRGILAKTADKRESDVFSRDLYRDLHTQKFVIPPKIYLFLGGAYFRKGMIKEALDQFKKTIELDSKSGEAHNNLAVIYFLTKDYDLAWKHLRLAEEFGAKVNPKFIEDLEKVYPEPEKDIK